MGGLTCSLLVNLWANRFSHSASLVHGSMSTNVCAFKAIDGRRPELNAGPEIKRTVHDGAHPSTDEMNAGPQRVKSASAVWSKTTMFTRSLCSPFLIVTGDEHELLDTLEK